MDAADEVREALFAVTERKESYEKGYQAFRKLLCASDKRIPLSETMDYIGQVVVDSTGKIVVKWVDI